MEYTTQDLVKLSVSGDALKAAEVFNSLAAERIAASIEDKKIELAQQIFNASQDDQEDNPYDEEEQEETEDAPDVEEEEEDENS
jgi:hypothetical protein